MIEIKAPSDEGAVIFLRKMTEGEKAINNEFSLSLPPSRLRRATYCPLAVSRFCLCGLERRTKSTAAPTDAPFIRHRRRSHMLPVRGSLKFRLHFNLIAADNCFVFVGLLRSVGIFINSYKINLTIPPPHVRSAPPFTQGRLKMRSSVNLI